MAATRRSAIRWALAALWMPGVAKAASNPLPGVGAREAPDLLPGWKQLLDEQDRLIDWERSLLEEAQHLDRVFRRLDGVERAQRRRERLLDLRERFGSEAVRTLDWREVRLHSAENGRFSRFGARSPAWFGCLQAENRSAASCAAGTGQFATGRNPRRFRRIASEGRAPARVTGIDACRRGAILACGQVVKAGVRPAENLPIPAPWRAYQAPEWVGSVGSAGKAAHGPLWAGCRPNCNGEGATARAESEMDLLSVGC